MLFAGDQSLATKIDAYWVPGPMDEVHRVVVSDQVSRSIHPDTLAYHSS